MADFPPAASQLPEVQLRLDLWPEPFHTNRAAGDVLYSSQPAFPLNVQGSKGHAEGADNEIVQDCQSKIVQETLGATTLYGYLQAQADLHLLAQSSGALGVIAQDAAKTAKPTEGWA